MELKKESWGEFEGHPAVLYTVTDPKTGFLVQVSDFGATLVRVKVADKNGNVDDVNFGQNSPTEFKEFGGYLGAVIGRVANRIGNAKFELEGKTYSLFVNNSNKHCLHGGKIGFNFKFWDCIEEKATKSNATIKFKYVSPDGEEGFPGTLTTICTYIIKPNEISWEFESTTDKTTIINLTNHAYWNLEGLNTTIDDQILKVEADKFMPGDETLIPTGEIKDVANTARDFRKGAKFSDVFKLDTDIDNNFFLRDYKPGKLKMIQAAELISPKTGRVMTVYTTEPCIQVYTGNFMGNIKSFGIQCKKHSAVCLETQRVPNAINFKEFRDSVILYPGQKYIHKTTHKFSIIKK